MNRFRLIVLLACLTLLPKLAAAQGHMLHGVGPINSSMGGAGAALTNDSLGALAFNPALIAGAQGNQISFTTEFFKDGIEIHTTLGSLSGDAHPSNQLGVIPAFGWMVRDPRKKMALGFGLIGIAGFRTDYPQDNASILFALPPNGFGRIYTDFRMTKIPIAVAFQVSPKLAVGGSFNTYLGEFAVAPLPHKVFDVDQQGDRWYPEAGALTNRFAFSGQFGFVYQISSSLSVGGSYTMKQNFSPYEWNSTIADPSSRRYGEHRRLDFDLDGPMLFSFGAGIKMNAKTQIAVDGMWTRYTDVEGFGSPGGIVDGIIYPFGWRDVWTFKTGVQHELTPKVTVRGGYNYSQMPLRGEVVLTATGAPATFQHHLTGGVGVKIFPFLSAEAAGYYVPRQHVVGPFPDINNNVLGTIDESNTIKSVLIGFNFHF
jgi:long-chain fatty acid transport protein